MLIAFEKSDFYTRDRWAALLEKLNVPPPVRSNISSIVIETKMVNVTEKIGADVSTVRFNPDESTGGC